MEKSQYRPDIDGLRAIAVTGVVLFHAAPNLLPSGFVGVDIFFVISGYLIGGIVFAASTSGRFSFANFYARRARRILPALIAIICFISFVGFFFFDSKELVEYSGQSIMALGGISNFYFWEHTDYFATNSSHEPLLMTWSLGVEEQFYVIFPFFMIIVARFQAWRRIALVVVAIAASFGLSLYMTSHHPISAFYLLPPRAWEMAAGALLAIIHHDAPRTRMIAGQGTNVAACFGLAAVIASTLLFDEQTPFPGLAALLPVIGTMVLIQTGHSFVNTRLLGTAPFVFIGRVSYSWYLWHWPLMALVRRASDVPPSAHQMLLVALCSLIMGILSWHFIERPFREQHSSTGTTLLRYALALAVAAMPPVVYKLSHGLPSRLPAQVAVVEKARLEGRGDCLTQFDSVSMPDGANCAPRGATIALLGDSHASAFGLGLVQAAQARGLRVRQVSKSSCRPFPGFTHSLANQPQHAEECATFLRTALTSILDDPKIDTIVVAAAWPTLDDDSYLRTPLNGAPKPVTATVAMQEGLVTLAGMAAARGKTMILVADVASLDFDPPMHMVGEALPLRRILGTLFDGSRRVPHSPIGLDHIDGKFAGTRDQVMAIARSLPSVVYFDPYLQLCDQTGCSYAQGDEPRYYDKDHLSAEGSRMIDWTAVLNQTHSFLRLSEPE
jgi:peptidoglycan/LPS O-acetylase OafA/YrhL